MGNPERGYTVPGPQPDSSKEPCAPAILAHVLRVETSQTTLSRGQEKHLLLGPGHQSKTTEDFR